MLEGSSSPNFNLSITASYDPLSQYDQFSDAINATTGELELGDLFSTLEDPYAAFRIALWS